MAARALALGLLAVFTAACAPLPPLTVLPPPSQPAYAGYASSKYTDARAWLCRPDIPGDHCHVDLTATEIHPDGTRAVVPYLPAKAPKVDCFYVYPTVDLGIVPGNHTDFADLAPMAATTAAQAARLGEVCDLYVPLYRQVTIGTYFFGGEARERRFEVAFSDVADAFAHYLGQYNHGRKVVLVGHSQGAEMVVRLVHRFFEKDPALRERLLLVLAIGGAVEVPRGALVGGTFATVPLCSRADETGCLVAYHTHRAESDPYPGPFAPEPGNVTACVSPASVDRNERRWFSRTYLPSAGHGGNVLGGVEGVATPFVLYRDLYAGQCVEGPQGYRYLEVEEAPRAGDTRKGLLDIKQFGLNTGLGLHVLDLQLPQGDIIDMIARRAAALP